MRSRVVVVGAGSAGCVLASQVAERHDVTLLEAGRWVNPPSGVGSDGSGESMTHQPFWSLSAALIRHHRWTATPGRAVGGSSVVNGGYFAAPEPADLRDWHARGGAAWEPQRVLAHIDAAARRLGAHPSPQTHPIARAFAQACADSGSADGLLPLLTTVAGGVARNAADAYLTPSSSGITLRTDCRALRIVTQNQRAVGVEIADADGTREVITADEIVLCAGGFGTPRLLLASGIGPASSLRHAGIDPIVDLPGVGAAFSDHPTVWVEWTPAPLLSRRDSRAEAADGAFPIALRAGADGGPGDDIEILACTQPPDPHSGTAADAPRFGFIVGLQRPHSRGTVVAASAHPLAAPRIDYAYLEDLRDRAALRAGVRLAAALLSSQRFAGLVERLVDLDEQTLRDDDLLDRWIAERLISAAHACGTAPMGPDGDPFAVVDGAGRVRGVRGLRIADTSLLPVVPSRAPAPAAMAIGAVIADQI